MTKGKKADLPTKTIHQSSFVEKGQPLIVQGVKYITVSDAVKVGNKFWNVEVKKYIDADKVFVRPVNNNEEMFVMMPVGMGV